ncbi:hypothetical protein [Candidatus Nitrosotalea okcheonensis]|uniref:Uncharacterized protein n=1 Tax=Candidatus Nitrosotalea okcheonensis TaxID=1903276 RepID=A0A2H1FCB0_9ARCH|nr:hypothetical protein [Candidatus Nitrosotalea okcheonensis]MDE1841727.1 hypothetical protein [Nitrososphaerota archaeon]SMH70398.1 protein of unknown function [Candidatus Nitrosotalea okcheonensis]
MTSAILLFGISVILISSYLVFDSQLKFNAFAQIPGDPNAGPIPEGNFTITSTGPIPEDNSTDPTAITNPMDGIPDASSMNQNYSNTIPSIDNMTSLGNMASPDNMTDNVNIVGQDNMTGLGNMSPSSSTYMSTNSTFSRLPPLEQVKSGVSPKDVTCKQGFTLIMKADDGSPACVDPQVMQILIQRGW